MARCLRDTGRFQPAGDGARDPPAQDRRRGRLPHSDRLRGGDPLPALRSRGAPGCLGTADPTPACRRRDRWRGASDPDDPDGVHPGQGPRRHRGKCRRAPRCHRPGRRPSRHPASDRGAFAAGVGCSIAGAMFWKLPALGKISKIGIVPPRPEPGREGVAVALIVKNEARHIGEWAAFHRRAGVRRFLVYDNGGTDGDARDPARGAARGGADHRALAAGLQRRLARARDPQPGAGLCPCGVELRRGVPLDGLHRRRRVPGAEAGGDASRRRWRISATR